MGKKQSSIVGCNLLIALKPGLRDVEVSKQHAPQPTTPSKEFIGDDGKKCNEKIMLSARKYVQSLAADYINLFCI